MNAEQGFDHFLSNHEGRYSKSPIMICLKKSLVKQYTRDTPGWSCLYIDFDNEFHMIGLWKTKKLNCRVTITKVQIMC